MTEKKYCCLCNADMNDDKNKEKQEWFFPTDGFERWYCSKCSEKAESIEREYIDRANNLRAKHEYYNPIDLIMMVESLYVNRDLKHQPHEYLRAIQDFTKELKHSLTYNYKHLIRRDTDGFDWLTTDAVETHIDKVIENLLKGVD